MLRDPVERAFSAYKHEYARGYEWESFEQALELEDDRLIGEITGCARPRLRELHHRHHSYTRRGHYADQLERIFGLFPREQVHVMDSEAFFARPAQEYEELTGFLGLRPFQPASFGQHNARPGTPMAPGTQRMLDDHFAPITSGWPSCWTGDSHGHGNRIGRGGYRPQRLSTGHPDGSCGPSRPASSGVGGWPRGRARGPTGPCRAAGRPSSCWSPTRPGRSSWCPAGRAGRRRPLCVITRRPPSAAGASPSAYGRGGAARPGRRPAAPDHGWADGRRARGGRSGLPA